MATSDEKLDRFVQAITAYANEQKDAILREVSAYKASVLAKAEEDVMRESSAMIEEERKELLSSLSREMSGRELEARRSLLKKRQALTDTVFADATRQIEMFTKTADYEALLAGSVAAIKAQLPVDGTVFCFREADRALAEKLLPGATVRLTKDIVLGGVRAENDTAGQIFDDTLDTRLAGQKDWFLAHSGLTIQ